jgi:hypothetical protein
MLVVPREPFVIAQKQPALERFQLEAQNIAFNLLVSVSLSVFEIAGNIMDGDYRPGIPTPLSHAKVQYGGIPSL